MGTLGILLMMMGGLLVSSQSSVNASLGRRIGTIEGALISFLTGTGLLAILVLFFGRGNLFALFEAPKWQLLGVFCGVLFVLINITVVPKIGMISTSILVISGQLSMGLIIDHFGWFHVTVIPLDAKRGLAILFMVLALYFIYKGNVRAKKLEQSGNKALKNEALREKSN